MAALTNNICTKILQKLPKRFTRCVHIKNTLLNSATDSNVIRDILFAPVQSEKDKKSRKVSIIGAAGNIGQIMGYDLLLKRFCDELVLCDLPEKKEKLCGIGLDLLDGTPLGNHPKVKICINGENTNDSDLIIICAGLGVKTGQTRLEVLHDNADNFRTLIPMLANLSPDCVMLVVSNPVDIMAYAAWKFSGFPVNRVLGTGTCLDTSRFKFLLSKKIGISPKSINAWILGEHGQSCVAAWSSINVAGTRLRDCKECFGQDSDPECWDELEKQVKEQANVIKNFKGFTSYAIAMVVSELAEAILSDSKTVHSVSTCCNGLHGMQVESFLSLPAVIGNRGVHHIVHLNLDCIEQEKLKKSAAALDTALKTYSWEKDEKKAKVQCN